MLITLCNRESQHKWRRVKFIFEIVESEKDFALDKFEYDMKIRTKYMIIQQEISSFGFIISRILYRFVRSFLIHKIEYTRFFVYSLWM